MQCSNARLLSSDLQSSHLQQFRIIAHLTSDQLKACSDILSCAQGRTSGSSLVFPTSTLVRTILLQAAARRNNGSSFQIQFSVSHFHPQAFSSLFRNFDWKIARFHQPQCGRTRNLYLPLDPDLNIKKANSH